MTQNRFRVVPKYSCMLHVNTGKVNARCQDLTEVRAPPITVQLHAPASARRLASGTFVLANVIHTNICCCFCRCSSIPTAALQLVGRLLANTKRRFYERNDLVLEVESVFSVEGNCQSGLKGEKGEMGPPGSPASPRESTGSNTTQ